MKTSPLIIASLLIAADILVKALIFGWYWPSFKITHLVSTTWKRDPFDYLSIDLEISKEATLALCKRDNFSNADGYSPARTLLEARMIGMKREDPYKKKQVEAIFLNCNSKNLDFLLTTSCAFCGSTCRRSGWWWSSRRRRRSLPSHCDDQSIVRHFERDNTMWRTFDPSVVTCNPKVKIRAGRRQWRRERYPDQI